MNPRRGAAGPSPRSSEAPPSSEASAARRSLAGLAGRLVAGRPLSGLSLSGLDSLFLSLETRATPMNVMGALVLDVSSGGGGYSYARLLQRVAERAPRLPPFRRRLLAMPLGLDHPVWIDDPALDVRRHVEGMRAPAPGSDRVLAGLVARMASQPLDRSRPLWQLRVVEGLSEERVGLVFKIHHAAADGVSAALLMLQLLGPSAQGDEPTPARRVPPPAPTRPALLAHAAARLPRRALRLGRLVGSTAVSVVAMSRSAAEGPARDSRMPMPFSTPRTPWNGAVSSRRTVAFGSARLADVKAVSKSFDASVNHVVLAACTQSLRTYLESRGGAPDAPLVAAIPVSTRGPEEVASYGNRISAVLVHLPVHRADPVEQLLALRDDAASSGRQHARLGLGALAEWAEFAHTGLLGAAARLYSALELASRHRPLHNLVISNVRGPEAPLYAAGARLGAAYPLGPLMEGAGLNLTVLSYAGSVDFGLIACERSVPRAAEIALGFGAGIAQLRKRALETSPRSRPSRRTRVAPRSRP